MAPVRKEPPKSLLTSGGGLGRIWTRSRTVQAVYIVCSTMVSGPAAAATASGLFYLSLYWPSTFSKIPLFRRTPNTPIFLTGSPSFAPTA